MGVMMIFGQPRFILRRYESFHRFFRKQDISVDEKKLSKFYSILYFVTSIPLLVGAIIGFINNEMFKEFSLWLVIAVVVIGVAGIIYCNISKRFLKTIDN
jgi:uncharacterized membrane protein YoaK (UPF0700 family)